MFIDIWELADGAGWGGCGRAGLAGLARLCRKPICAKRASPAALRRPAALFAQMRLLHFALRGQPAPPALAAPARPVRQPVYKCYSTKFTDVNTKFTFINILFTNVNSVYIRELLRL